MVNNEQLREISRLLDNPANKPRLSGKKVAVGPTGVGGISPEPPHIKKST